MINSLAVLALLSVISIPVPGIAPNVLSELLSFTWLNVLFTRDWLSPQI